MLRNILIINQCCELWEETHDKSYLLHTKLTKIKNNQKYRWLQMGQFSLYPASGVPPSRDLSVSSCPGNSVLLILWKCHCLVLIVHKLCPPCSKFLSPGPCGMRKVLWHNCRLSRSELRDGRRGWNPKCVYHCTITVKKHNRSWGMKPVCFIGTKQNDPVSCINTFDGDDLRESRFLCLVNKGIWKWT